jgi:hypothetical protein
MEATAAAEATQHLLNYGALGLCLVLALVALWYVDLDRTKIHEKLEAEQKARVDDAKAYMDLALELQRAELQKVTELKAVAEVLNRAIDRLEG